MTWLEKRGQITDRMNVLANQNQNNMSVDQLQTVKQEYDQLRYSLTVYLKEQAKNYALSDKLTETGQLQTQIQRLHDQNDKMKTDVETAVARDELLRSRNRSGNDHTLYLLDRPVQRQMVPILWVISVLFVGIGVLFFYWLSPQLLPSGVSTNTFAQGTASSGYQMITDVFTSRFTWMALFGAASIVILFLSLNVAGVFGK